MAVAFILVSHYLPNKYLHRVGLSAQGRVTDVAPVPQPSPWFTLVISDVYDGLPCTPQFSNFSCPLSFLWELTALGSVSWQIGSAFWSLRARNTSYFEDK